MMRRDYQLCDTTGLNSEKLSRRDFLSGLVRLGAIATLLPISASALEKAVKELNSSPLKDPWLTIAGTQNILFPSDGNGPGALEINALAYLKAVTQQPQLEAYRKKLLFNGVGWLNDLSEERYQARFAAVDTDRQKELIRITAGSRVGENWLSLLMTYIIESLLSAPVYGGNPNGVGWKWLQHQPGFPLPPADKKWYLL